MAHIFADSMCIRNSRSLFWGEPASPRFGSQKFLKIFSEVLPKKCLLVYRGIKFDGPCRPGATFRFELGQHDRPQSRPTKPLLATSFRFHEYQPMQPVERDQDLAG